MQRGDDLATVKLSFCPEHEKRPGDYGKTNIYMLYDSREPPLAPEVKELSHKARENKLNVLLGCDVNSHHGSEYQRKGLCLHNFIMLERLLNRGNESTCMDRRRNS